MIEIEEVQRIHDYLASAGWSPAIIAVCLDVFEKTHGTEARSALFRFIDYAEQHNKEPGWIAAQIGHDLNICDNATASPRTARY